MVYGIGSGPDDINPRTAVYYGGGRSGSGKSVGRNIQDAREAAKRQKRQDPYAQWFGQVPLVTPPKGGRHGSWLPTKQSKLPPVRHYQQQVWNKWYTAVKLGGPKGPNLDKGGNIRKEAWFEPAPEGMTAGKWYDPKDLTMTTPMGNRNVGRQDSAWYGGIITGIKPEVVVREKARVAQVERERKQIKQELQEIEDLKQQKIDFERQQQEMAVLASQQEARTQQLVTETARQEKIDVAAEALRAKREARRAKVSPASGQFQVTKPKKAKVTRRRYTPQRPRPYTRDPQRASTPW